jgi:hypothetical protein
VSLSNKTCSNKCSSLNKTISKTEDKVYVTVFFLLFCQEVLYWLQRDVDKYGILITECVRAGLHYLNVSGMDFIT